MKVFNDEIKMALFLIVLTILCTSALAVGNYYYEQAPAYKQTEFHMDILRSFGDSFTPETFHSVFSEYVEIIEYPEIEDAVFYYYNKEPRQVAVRISGSGLWSIIELFIFINIDDLVIRELRVLDHGETPGMGGRIEEPWFLDQFAGLDVKEGVKVVEERVGDPGEVDAITGATLTSDAIESIVNTALTPLLQ